MDTTVALKELAIQEAFVELQREAVLLRYVGLSVVDHSQHTKSKLNHPNIVRFLGVHSSNLSNFIVMVKHNLQYSVVIRLSRNT